jgi:hypothetical protein
MSLSLGLLLARYNVQKLGVSWLGLSEVFEA